MTPTAALTRSDLARRPFVKMNGLGNDFVIVNVGDAAVEPEAELIRSLADRGAGIGFDQFILIAKGASGAPLVRFWNADGAEAGACGNGSRCVARLLMQASGADQVRFETRERALEARSAGGDRVCVDLGPPRLAWDEIPLAEEMDTRGIELQLGPIDDPVLHTPGCVSMGNPHVVFFVPDAETAPVVAAGSLVERHPLFPEGVNVGFCQVLAPDRLRNRVWERGAGLTRACGTGACAALVAAHRRGLCGRSAEVLLDGGPLEISWRSGDDHVLMTGAASFDYSGTLS